MRYGEPIAALRLVPIYLVDGAGDPVEGATPTGEEIRVSLSGMAWINAAGTWTELGDGLYTYEATVGETITESFLLLRVETSTALIYVYSTDIGDRIPLGVAAIARRLPIYLVDDDGLPAGGLDLDGDIVVSVAGGPLTAASGTWTEIGLGGYYYELHEFEIVSGAALLRVSDVDARVYVLSYEVRTNTVIAPDEGSTGPVQDMLTTGAGIPEIDLIARALSRLPSMYRGSVDA